MNGNGGNDTIKGDADDDTIMGGMGDDTLHGGEDDDTLNGELGNDELYGEGGNDTLTDGDLPGIDMLDGGKGVDTADFSGINATDGNTDGREWFHVSLIDGLSEVRRTTADNGADGVTTTLMDIGDIKDVILNVENVTGSAGPNHLVGDDKDNMLTGGTADDKIKGMGGNDTIDGGVNSDGSTELLDGGAGNDTLVVTGTFNLNVGADGNQTADQKVEMGVRNFENLAAPAEHSDPVNFTGDAGPNMLIGGDGADTTLDGGAGDDTLNGGKGEDTLTGGLGADTFIIVKGQGADTIADYSGTGTGGQGDKIYLKGFTAADKEKGIYMDGDPIEIQVPEGTDPVVTLTGVSSRTGVTVMFMD